ncbi:uncharacterized protein LOC127060116 [Serinus canaria]|uniref:uncharacterized protein LOC127060116 n=1 Tax=Serinus canaria TaxID=9135 RepID=UPI0021CD06F2|nr:uncharacterized protein LOC127060116 [Serinus canaria]XP_050835713.1 uncharacterized protein LOC127060116 [Serinus canaria]
MKAISHFIRQFRCQLHQPGASTAVHSSSPAPQPRFPLRGAQPFLGPRWSQQAQAGSTCEGGLGLLLVGHHGQVAGNTAAQAGSAGSQLSLAAWATQALCLKPLGLAVPFSTGGHPAPPGSLSKPFCPLLSAPCGEGMALGLGLVAAAFSHTSLPRVPQQSRGAREHLGTQPSSWHPGISPGKCFVAPPCPQGAAGTRSRAGAAPGTWPGWHPRPGDTVTPRGWTISKCLHVQDMNQPGQECSSRAGTPGAAPEAARQRCQIPGGLEGRSRAAAAAWPRCHLQISPGHGKPLAWHAFPCLHGSVPPVPSRGIVAPSQGHA